MLIKDIYHKTPRTVPPDMPIVKALEVMKDLKTNGLLVTKDNKLVGVLALQDIAGDTVPDEFKKNIAIAAAMPKMGFFKEMCDATKGKKVSDLMRKDYVAVKVDTHILAVMADFLEHDLYIVPVLKGDKLMGEVTRSDIRKALLSVMQGEE